MTTGPQRQPPEEGQYRQELGEWERNANFQRQAKTQRGDYAAYMQSIGMGHQVPPKKEH